MPVIFRDEYGIKPRRDGGWMVITPTRQRFVENDHTDVRLDRVRIFDENGNLVNQFLRDRMFQIFVDNLPGTEDDLRYLESLPVKEKKIF